jgi:hypothetical protein
MPTNSGLFWVLPICLTVVANPGCQLFHDYKPVTVLVRDAETKQPISNANVTITHHEMLDPFVAHDSAGVTGVDGQTHLQTATDPMTFMSLTAQGYLPLYFALSSLPDTNHKGQMDNHPMTVELYALPGPTVELTLPNDYRGLLKIEVLPTAEQGIPGQRTFEVNVAASGIVQAKLPAGLARQLHIDVKARFADGTPVKNDPTPAEIGLRWVTCINQGDEFFVVGTERDYKTAMRPCCRRGSDGTVQVNCDCLRSWKGRQVSNSQKEAPYERIEP